MSVSYLGELGMMEVDLKKEIIRSTWKFLNDYDLCIGWLVSINL